jgi:hypothetical protein
MTESEVVAVAAREAAELNWPWDASAVTTTRWRLWPFPPRWRVISRVVDPEGATGSLAISTMLVFERPHGGLVVPVSVVYTAVGIRGEGDA